MIYKAIFDGANRVSRWFELFGENGLIQRYIEKQNRFRYEIGTEVFCD